MILRLRDAMHRLAILEPTVIAVGIIGFQAYGNVTLSSRASLGLGIVRTAGCLPELFLDRGGSSFA